MPACAITFRDIGRDSDRVFRSYVSSQAITLVATRSVTDRRGVATCVGGHRRLGPLGVYEVGEP